MSSNTRTNNNRVNKPFCKVCHDAGKPESVYNNHFVRSAPGPNGKVVCPTLLSLECRYCYKSGHTVKFCPVLMEKNKNQDRAEERERSAIRHSQKKEQKSTVAKPTNAYDALNVSDEESDEETKVSTIMNEQFPVLGGAKSSVQEAVVKPVFSYANALTTEKPKPKPVEKSVPVIVAAAEKPQNTIPQKIVKTWNGWVDCPESDDEEYDYEEDQATTTVKKEEYVDNSAW
jgi:hypothetical protein